MPTVLSHFTLVFLSLTTYLSLSLRAPLLLPESVDFSGAGNETALPCDSQQERGAPWGGKEEEVHRVTEVQYYFL